MYFFQILLFQQPFFKAPLQQQRELQLLFGCCQQQAERLVGRFNALQGADAAAGSHSDISVIPIANHLT